MATHSTDTVIAHTTDAEFRAWAAEFEAAMVAIGFVATADTGQMTIASATRPVANTAAGYRVYRTNDGLANIFIKAEYGTGASATYPGVWFTTGSGTDGAGTITASGSVPRQSIVSDNAPTSTTTSYLSRGAGGTGWWWFTFKVASGNGNSQTMAQFVLNRFANGSGTAIATGFVFYGNSTSTFSGRQVRVAGPFVSPASAAFCLLPANVTAGAVDTDIQFWKHYTAQPRMRVNPYVLSYDSGAVAEGSQRSMTVVGATATNFIATGSTTFKTCGVGAATTTTCLLLPWQ